MNASSKAADTNTAGFSARTSNKKLRIERATKKDATPPTTTPINNMTAIWRVTSKNTLRRVAPSAMRNPISIVRRFTFQATSP
jgi:hypothetical protein